MRRLHEQDLAAGRGAVPLPGALARKLPGAPREWTWQWLFPAPTLATEPGTGARLRWHLHPTRIQRAVGAAARAAAIPRRITCHALRHFFATHLPEAGCGLRPVQELLDHRHATTTMIYTHVLSRGGLGVTSPLDLP